uniref:Activated RNA polymerase II transcriptional coactivator p15 n=1 Tax=Eptatretus burgeri TaxID=7764 RepID=A0A8C4QEN1_EPTBU
MSKRQFFIFNGKQYKNDVISSHKKTCSREISELRARRARIEFFFRMSKSREFIDNSSESDSDSDSDEPVKPVKPVKPTKSLKSHEDRKRSAPSADPPAKKGRTDAGTSKVVNSSDGDDNLFQLGRMRYVSVREFKGKVLVDLREHYTDQGGDMKPGRKGIALQVDQWSRLKELIPEIDTAIAKL